jgi:hypothetical protein
MKAVKAKTLQPHFVADFLKLINDASTEKARLALIEKHCKNKPFDMLFYLAFNPRIKLDLPEGAPPFKRDTEIHPDLKSPLATQITYLKACTPQSPATKIKKEKLFIDVCEAIPPCDADILICCKDKNLESLYPNITADLVAKVFPNYVNG